MVNEMDGDLIILAQVGEFDVILHGRNGKRTFGAGLALSIKKAFPEAAIADSKFINNKLGEIDCVYIPKYYLTVINMYTQIGFGKANSTNDTQENRYQAIKNGMRKVNALFKGKKIGVPAIGAGLAGGDWKIIRQIIYTELRDCDVTIVYFNK